MCIALPFFGLLIKVKNINTKGALTMMVIAFVGSAASILGMMFWKCDQPRLAGAIDNNVE